MKKYFLQYKPFLVFIGSFFLVYVGLTFIYQNYLNSFSINTIDGITQCVGKQVVWVLNQITTGVQSWLQNGEVYVSYKNNTKIRIVEGCNAVSVFILFVAFVVAFTGNFKDTIVFSFLGILFLYVLNVSRIVLLVLLMHQFPAWHHFLHGVFFPLLIYGSLFVLWFVWITKYSKYVGK